MRIEGSKLEALRANFKFSQTEVAVKIGVSLERYQKYENTYIEGNIGAAKDIAEIFNVNYKDITGLQTSSSSKNANSTKPQTTGSIKPNSKPRKDSESGGFSTNEIYNSYLCDYKVENVNEVEKNFINDYINNYVDLYNDKNVNKLEKNYYPRLY